MNVRTANRISGIVLGLPLIAAGLVFIIGGLALCLWIIGAIIGIPAIVLGVVMLSAGVQTVFSLAPEPEPPQ